MTKVLFVYPIKHPFKVGDKVIDLTGVELNSDDQTGVVKKVDGSNILVRYDTGNERWKMHISLRSADE